MTMIPAFGPWTEHPADTDEEKRLASAQQSKTSPLSVDKEHETGVFYGSGKEPYQTSLASCTCNDFVKRKKPCKHVFRLAMELGIIDAAYKTGRSTGERNEAQLSFADCLDLVEQLSDAAQNEIKEMLRYTSERVDDRQKPITCHELDLVPELRTSPLLHENPYPLEEVLNDLPKPFVVQLLDLVHREGKPKRNAAKTVMAAWLAQNAPMLARNCRRSLPSRSLRCSTKPSVTFTSTCTASTTRKQTGTPAQSIPPGLCPRQTGPLTTSQRTELPMPSRNAVLIAA